MLTNVDSAGRFFANHLLKLLMGQIVLRYDIKPNTKPRPQNPVSILTYLRSMAWPFN